MTGSSAGYAGDITPSEAWEILKSDAHAALVDVRTVAEWNYVGLPTLADLDKRPVLCEWQRFPQMDVAADFVEMLSRDLEASGVDKDTPVVFLCRSGARSRSAAIAMTAAGYTKCFNISGGFEGPHDVQKHRGTVEGWKASGLPWAQA